jgi:hypothetical protein
MKTPTVDKQSTSTEDRAVAVSEGELTTRVYDHAAERALCFKFDIRILPVLALMYLFNA